MARPRATTLQDRIRQKCEASLVERLVGVEFNRAFMARTRQSVGVGAELSEEEIERTVSSDAPRAVSDSLRLLARLVGVEVWPVVLIDVAPGRDPAAELERWRAYGYPPAAVPGFPDAEPGMALADWNLLLVRVPPHVESRYLGPLVEDDAVLRLYDAGQTVHLPEPIYDESLQPDLVDSGDLVYRGELPAELDRDTAGRGVKVAVVDSGIDEGHPAFRDVSVVARKDFTSGGEGPGDINGHGTHCAGIIAASPVGEARVRGIAPGVSLIDAKVFERSGSGSTMAVAAGLHWAVKEAGAQVVNLSLGGPGVTDGQSMLSRLCDAMAAEGVVVVVSAGNSGTRGISVPGDAAQAITVAAVDKQGKVTSFSSRGPTADPSRTGDKPNLAAPGLDILAPRARRSARGSGDYIAMSGTSMAAPHVAGAAAALRGFAPDASGEDIRRALIESCARLPGESRGAAGACSSTRTATATASCAWPASCWPSCPPPTPWPASPTARRARPVPGAPSGSPGLSRPHCPTPQYQRVPLPYPPTTHPMTRPP